MHEKLRVALLRPLFADKLMRDCFLSVFVLQKYKKVYENRTKRQRYKTGFNEGKTTIP